MNLHPDWSPTFREVYLDKRIHDYGTLVLLLTKHAHDQDDVGKVGSAGLVMEAVACIEALERLRGAVRNAVHDSAKYPQLKMHDMQENRLIGALKNHA